MTDVCLRVWCMIGRVYRSVGDRYLTLLVELFFCVACVVKMKPKLTLSTSMAGSKQND